jgi:hypothetical protein
MASKKNKGFCQNDCDIMTYLTEKDYITAVIQVLSIHLPNYNMKLRTTKCLNTAIMTMFLLLGSEGIKKSEYCSVSKVKQRVLDKNISRNDEMIMFDSMIDDLFSHRETNRYFYYIMITDGEMLKSNDEKNYFPGHVFVIEKIPCGTKNKYKLYQSYINEYTLKGHYQKNNNSMEISEPNLKKIFGKTGYNAKNNNINANIKQNGISIIFSEKYWNSKTSQFWKKLTYVESEKYNGFSTNELKFCYKKVRVSNCYKILNTLVTHALQNLNKNPNFYNLPEAIDEPLSSKDLINKLKNLQIIVKEKYNIKDKNNNDKNNNDKNDKKE